MTALLVAVLAASLLGSLHCVGMCGGLIAVASDGASGVRQRVGVQLAYQAARLGSYVLLGAVAGTLGRALDLAGQAAGLGKAAAIVSGLTMTVWGVWAMLAAAGARLRLPALRLLPSSALGWLGRARQRSPLVRALLLGGASALLPCGFLYAFALAAAATASPWSGALVLSSLWLGSLPALLGFGLLLSTALARLKRHIPFFSAAAVFALGVVTLNTRMNLPALAASVTAPAAAASEPSPPAMPADCPMHRKGAP